jgi:hypothetical protein
VTFRHREAWSPKWVHFCIWACTRSWTIKSREKGRG